MLVLGRKQDQVICIGDQIRVMVVRTCDVDGYVRIGIEAPKHIRVVREELLTRKRRKKCTGSGPADKPGKKSDEKENG